MIKKLLVGLLLVVLLIGGITAPKLVEEVVRVKMAKPILLASSNWTNSAKAGVAYLNSNNDATNSNTNIGRQLELRDKPLNKHFNLYRKVKYTTMEGGC